MADEVASFQFTNNAIENAEEIARGLNQAVRSIHEAARAAGGTSVPLSFGTDIIRETERAVAASNKAMERMLDPRQIEGKFSIAQVGEALSKSSVGAFQRIQLEVDKLVSQLGPTAQRSLAESGKLDQIMHEAANAVAAEIRQAYASFRDTLTAEQRRQLPPVSRLPAVGSRNSPEGRLGNEEYTLSHAAVQRMNKVFPLDAEGGELGTDSNAFLAAEVRADAARVAHQAAKDKVALERARVELSRALADMVGTRGEDPFAKALGLKINPATGVPAKRMGSGYEDITDPRTITEQINKLGELRRVVQETRGLLDFDQARQIGSSRFFTKEDSDGVRSFYERATASGVQYLRMLDDTETRYLSLRDARRAFEKEQNAPVEKARVDREKEAARQREQALKDAEREERQANARREADARRTRGFIPGVVQGAFGSGFSGTGALDQGAIMGNLGKTVGSAARYSLAYGGFYGFLQALREGISIFADYQDSFTDYQVALGGAGGDTQAMTNDLMELSRVLGENVGAAYDSAARGVRAFASDASEAEKAAAGVATASAAQKVSIIANKSLGDATGDIVAVGSAFGMNAQQTEQLLPDWLANAKRNIGGDPTQIAQGLSNFAVAANEAGFTGQEAADMVALIQSKTDESGQAVATRLARIVQIVSGSTGRNLAGDVNRALGTVAVDVTAQPKQQLEDFARAYVEAGKQGMIGLQGQIRSQLGGTSNLKELLPLLEDGGQERLAKALRDAISGAGQDEYERKINTIMSLLVRLRGSIQNIVVLAANADIFAPFAIGVKVLEPTLHVLEQILKVYEKFEGLAGPVLGPVGTTAAEAALAVAGFNKIRKTAFAADIAGTTGVVGATTRAAGVTAAAGTAGAAVAGAGANTAAAAANVRAAAAANALAAGEIRALGATNAFTAALYRSNIGASLDGLAGNASKFATVLKGAGVLAALIAIDKISTQSTKADSYDARELGLLASIGTDPAKMRNNADAVESLGASSAKELGFGSTFNNNTQWDNTLKERTAAEATLLREMERGGATEKKRADAMRDQSVFGEQAGRTADKIAEGFASLASDGQSASQALDTYFRSLMRPPAEVLGSWETPQTTTNAVLDQLGKGANSYVNRITKNGIAPGGGLGKKFDTFFGPDNFQGITSDWFGTMPNPFLDTKGDVARNLNFGPQMQGVRKKVLAGIKEQGDALDQAGLNRIVTDAVADLDLSAVTGEYEDFNADAFREKLVSQVSKNVKVLGHQASVLKPLTPAELEGLLTAQDAAVAQADPTDPTAQARQARKNYLMLQARINATGTPGNARRQAMAAYNERTGSDPAAGTANLDSLFHGVMRTVAGNVGVAGFGALKVAAKERRHLMREFAVKEAEDARAVQESLVADESDGVRAAARLKGARVSMRKAGADVALLEPLMESLDRQTVKTLLGYRKAAMDTAKMALDHQNRLYAEAQAILDEEYAAGREEDGPRGDFQREEYGPKAPTRGVDEARKHYRRRRQLYLKGMEAYNRSAFTSETPDEEGDAEKLTARQRAALLAQAQASPNNSSIQARRGLEVARANLAAIKDKSSSEYYSALQSVNQAEQTLASTLVDRTTAAANLSAAVAGGGAMATAHAAITAAQAQIGLTDPGSTERLNAQASLAGGQWQMRQAVAGRIGAVASARASRIGGGIAEGRAAIIGAAANLRANARGTAEWFSALGSFYDAKNSMREAVMAYKNNRDLLRGDSTDPVEQARDAVRAARRAIREARSRDEKAEARVGADEARNSLRGAKFDQRLSDMQTAEDLGRISFRKYMDYLDHEHDRLSRIHKRTRQQQDQLDTVDKAMKDAKDSMDGQFNLGDINTRGLVYQVRRFAAESRAHGPGQQNFAPVTNQTVTISVNGADTAKVKQVIDGYLRIQGGQRQSLTRRKV